MWQVYIFWEHTVANLEAACVRQAELHAVSVKITFTLNYFHRFYRVYTLLTFCILVQSNYFDTDCIVQALLVYYVSDSVFLTTFDITVNDIFALF